MAGSENSGQPPQQSGSGKQPAADASSGSASGGQQTTPAGQQPASATQPAAGTPPASTPAAETATPTAPLDVTIDCVIAGLKNIGIKADANTIIDFGAIDSDNLCVAMAHTIESCMAAKGWLVKPLSADLTFLRKQGRKAPVTQLAQDIAKFSMPISSIGGGSK